MASVNASVENEDFSQFSDDMLIAQWHKTAGIAATWKAKEAAMREEVVRRVFKDNAAGTYNRELGKGYVLKCTKKETFKVVETAINPTLDKIRALGNEGTFLAARLIKWKPEFAKSEFNKAPENVQKLILEAIEIKPAMPTLEIVEPKKR